MATYSDVIVDREVDPGSAWTYPDPSPLASSLKDHVAYWNSVKIISEE